MQAEKDKRADYQHDELLMYDPAGNYTDPDVGTDLATYRIEAAQSHDERRFSVGIAPALFPGALIKLMGYPDGNPGTKNKENQEYIVARCSHFYGVQTYRSGGGPDASYKGHYEFTPSSRPFRAPHITPKPRIPGYQTALVIRDKKNEGEEIDVDPLGRILVFFYWDRERKHARRIRVAPIWAGSNRGGLFVPRVGDEVLVQYEEGDPDRPIVIGSVYNGNNTVPMKLPDKKVKSGILTQSSKGGSGYNMLLFDDTAGSEIVKLRCQHDLMVKALNDETRVIGKDQSESITGNVTKTVQGNETINIGSTGGQYSLTATQKITLTVGASSITMDPSSITLNAPTITISATGTCTINGMLVKIN